MITPPSAMAPPSRNVRALSLVEVMVAMLILAILGTGLVASLIQTRRMTDGSIAQSAAQAAVESYMEQMENMNLSFLLNAAASDPNMTPVWTGNPAYPIPTQTDSITGGDALEWSNNANNTTTDGAPVIPDLNNLIPGNSLVDKYGNTLNVVDNFKEIPYNPGNQGLTTTWDKIWPKGTNAGWTNANNTPTPKSNALHMNIWVWVTDLTDASGPVPSATNPSAFAQKVYGITIIYTWQFFDGIATRYYMGTLHSIRSKMS